MIQTGQHLFTTIGMIQVITFAGQKSFIGTIFGVLPIIIGLGHAGTLQIKVVIRYVSEAMRG